MIHEFSLCFFFLSRLVSQPKGEEVLFPVTVREIVTSLSADPTDTVLHIHGHEVRTVRKRMQISLLSKP